MTVWTSKKQSITAVAGVRDDNGYQTGEILTDSAPTFKIEEGEKKGATVYRLYTAGLDGYRYTKTFKSLDKAIKFAENL